jgi:hypothetical protein
VDRGAPVSRTVRSPREQLHRAVTEDDLLTTIVQWATLRGWLIHHDRRSDRAITQGTPGFPDLVLARDGRVVFAELKSETGVLTINQVAWQIALRTAPAEYHEWRPSDLDAAIEVLR